MIQEPVRLAEVLSALAAATDLGMGQPPGHAVATAMLSVRLARMLGLRDGEVSDVLYVALLRYVGCTADAPEVAGVAGDEISLAAAVGPYVMGSAAARASHTPVADPETAMATAMAVHCEAAGMLGSRLGMKPAVLTALRHGFERWDGRGYPGGLVGSHVPIAVRIGVLARDVELWERLAGASGAREMVVRRRGRAYDPRVVDAYLTLGDSAEEVSWPGLIAAEPNPEIVSADRLHELLEVFADFADLKMPSALGHSRRVAAAAAGAGARLGMDAQHVDQLRRAGLVHDLGRTGISSGIWCKRKPWTADEWERVRLHPYLTERILQRSAPLARLATLAASHHERLDGSGYHRGVTGVTLTPLERTLAAADAFVSLQEPQPHRPALDLAATVHDLRAAAEAGLLDGSAVNAVIAAGGEQKPGPSLWPAGLSDREVDVLRLAVHGLTIRQVATRLHISPKTVDRHLQNSYAKIDVSSRAAAALYAMHHGLVD